MVDVSQISQIRISICRVWAGGRVDGATAAAGRPRQRAAGTLGHWYFGAR